MESNTPHDNHPIDRGWAWVVLFASFMECFLLIGNHVTFGMFFVEFTEKFNASASSIGIALSIQTITLSLVFRSMSYSFHKTLKGIIYKPRQPHTLEGSFFETFLLMGSRRNFGILFVEYMADYGMSASDITLVLSVQTISLSLASLLVLGIGSKICSNRVYVMAGGITGFAAYLINAFLPNITFLILSQGVLFGATHALCHGPSLVMIGRYFKKRRGLATTMSNVGASIGGLAFPPIIRVLLDTYGLRGALIIISGILLNFFVAGALMRPLSYYDRSQKTKNEKLRIAEVDQYLQKPLLKSSDAIGSTDKQCINGMKGNHTSSQDNSEHTYNFQENLTVEPMVRERSLTANSHDRPRKSPLGSTRSLHKALDHISNTNLAVAASTGDIIGSLYSLHSADFGATPDTKETISQAENKNCCQNISFSDVLKQLISVEVLKKRMFQLWIPVAFFAIIGAAQMVTFIPPLAVEVGISKEESVLLLTVIGATDLIGKFILVFLASINYIPKDLMIAVAMLILGIVSNLVPFFTAFPSMCIIAASYGVFAGVYFGLFPAVLAEYVGVENLSGAMGITMLLHGLSLSIANPILGYIKDSTGSFVGSFHLMGSALILSGLFMVVAHIHWRSYSKRDHLHVDKSVVEVQ